MIKDLLITFVIKLVISFATYITRPSDDEEGGCVTAFIHFGNWMASVALVIKLAQTIKYFCF